MWFSASGSERERSLASNVMDCSPVKRGDIDVWASVLARIWIFFQKKEVIDIFGELFAKERSYPSTTKIARSGVQMCSKLHAQNIQTRGNRSISFIQTHVLQIPCNKMIAQFMMELYFYFVYSVHVASNIFARLIAQFSSLTDELRRCRPR